MDDCLISICIPAYKRTKYLKRLLDSIKEQTFRDFEVIISDDSPGNEVEELCRQYERLYPLRFSKNHQALDTPENWNAAIRLARGRWIKLIHDDDWFSDTDSLQAFAQAIQHNPSSDFIFSAYANVYEDTGREQPMFLKPYWKNALAKNANILIADNVVGPPSVILHRNDQRFWYDRRMKYVVDIDFYIQYLQQASFSYIPKPLILVGINPAQVTKYTFGVAEVHLKEALLLLEKTDTKNFDNLLFFDGWWRLVRNFHIRKVEQVRAIGYPGSLPPVLLRMMEFQSKVPSSLLRNGTVSKTLMSLCYLQNRGKNG